MTVITSIGMDHVGLLGHTIQEIAMAKAGIMKPSSPVVIAPQHEKDAETTLIDHARSLNIDCILMTSAKPMDKNEEKNEEEENASSSTFDQLQQLKLCIQPKNLIHEAALLKPIDYQYRVQLQGNYQQENSATAIMVLEWLNQLGQVQLTKDIIKKGLLKTKWPGRLEWISMMDYPHLSTSFTHLLVDGAHNPPAMISLRTYVDHLLEKKGLKRVIWIIGVTQGKSIHEMLAHFIHTKDLLITVPFSQPIDMPWIQCIDPIQIAETASHHPSVFPQSTLLNGLQKASALFNAKTDLVVLCGSLYLVADLYRLLKIE
ncbi:unnamed protein product [Cunninghamella blakesleeana]